MRRGVTMGAMLALGPCDRPPRGAARCGGSPDGTCSAVEAVECAERGRQLRLERMEVEGARRVEPGLLRRRLVDERQQRRDGLADVRPAQRALVAVVVRRIDLLGDA